MTEFHTHTEPQDTADGTTYASELKGAIIRIQSELTIVTYRPTTRQRLRKHLPARPNARNNMTSIARRRISIQA